MQETVRIDKWLWASRFFKTRQIAQEAINSSKVTVNKLKVKPSRAIKIGDQLTIRRGAYTYSIKILGLSEKRLGAEKAQLLYQEDEQSIAQRELLSFQVKAQSLYTPKTDKRPDKKSRRQLIQFKKSK